MKTLPELAQQVLDVQDACNLSGVVHAWSAAITNLRELMPTAGTDAINRHPINKLWADKVAQLAGVPCFGDDVTEAHKVVGEMAESKSGPVEVMPTCPCCGAEQCDCAPTFPDEIELVTPVQAAALLAEPGEGIEEAMERVERTEPLKDSMHSEGI